MLIKSYYFLKYVHKINCKEFIQLYKEINYEKDINKWLF